MSDEYSFGGGTLKSLNFTDAWGISPGSGQALLPGNEFTPAAGDDFSFTFGARTIHGVVKNPVLKTTTDGLAWEVTLVDDREKLSWDSVQCQFNIVDIEDVDPEDFGRSRHRRYKNIYPDDWPAGHITWGLKSTRAILDLLFAAATVTFPWDYVDHPRLDGEVYNLDFDTGAELGAVIQQIADKLGLVVRLSGPYELSFALKGEGDLPDMTGANIREVSSGTALSGNATEVRIIGERDIYTDTGIQMYPDWSSAWEAYLFEPKWIDAVKTAYTLPDGTPSQRAALAAKARSITVLDWVLKTGNEGFEDYGRFGDVGRMHLPAWVYITQLVFKAYRITHAYTLNGIDFRDLRLVEGLLARVTSTTDGVMSYFLNDAEQFELYTDEKAYIIATGQQLDLSDPSKRDVLDPATISSLSALWTPCQRFRIDPRNYVVIFEDAVFQPGEDGEGLFTFVNAGTDLPADHPSKYLAVPNAGFTLTAPDMKGAFTFEAERYFQDFGIGHKRVSHYVSGLSLHALMLDNVFNTEIEYDTEPAEPVVDKAAKAAAAFLAREEFYASGTFVRLGAWGTDLTPTIDRVTYTLNTEGIREDIDLTKERQPDYFEPERELDRAKTSDELYPGMRANRDEVHKLQYMAKILAGLSTKQSRVYQDLPDVFKTPLGNVHSAPTLIKGESAVTYGAGEVIFTGADGSVSDSGAAFQGVVIAGGVTAELQLPIATQGVVPVKIQGPVEAGEQVGCETGSRTAISGGERAIGNVLVDYTGTSEVWLPVRLGASGPSAARTPLKLVKASVPTKLRVIAGTIQGLFATGMSPGDTPPFEFIPDIEVNDGQVWAVLGLDEDFNIDSFDVDSGLEAPPNTTGEIYHVIGTYHRDNPGEDNELIIPSAVLLGSQSAQICGSATSEVPNVHWNLV